MVTLLPPGRRRTLLALLPTVRYLPGDLAELGVYQGGSARLIADTIPDKPLHLFDTFAGLPEDDTAPDGYHKRGEFACPLDEVRANLRGCTVCFHPGVFPGTTADLPPDVTFCFVHLDCDLYRGTVEAIQYFWPRLTPGGVLLFDDFDWPKCPGVAMAVRSFFSAAAIETSGNHQAWVRKRFC
jgi:O-methyltransferase